MEKWKDVTGYEGLYQVSDLGRVKSLMRVVVRSGNATRRVPEIILAIAIQSQGYPVVTLSKKGISKKTPMEKIRFILMMFCCFLADIIGYPQEETDQLD